MLVFILCILPIIFWGQIYFQKEGRKKSSAVRDSQSKLADIMEIIASSTMAGILCNGTDFFEKA